MFPYFIVPKIAVASQARLPFAELVSLRNEIPVAGLPQDIQVLVNDLGGQNLRPLGLIVSGGRITNLVYGQLVQSERLNSILQRHGYMVDRVAVSNPYRTFLLKPTTTDTGTENLSY